MIRFWRTIESLSGLATVGAEWRALAGPDFDLAKSLLRPCDGRATWFPRLPPDACGPPYQVICHAADDYVGVCPETGEAIRLSPEDLILYELNRPSVVTRVAAGLGLKRDCAVRPGRGAVDALGSFHESPGQRLPAFLTFPLDSADLHTAALDLIAGGLAPFLLLAPTRRRLRPETEAALRMNGALFLALAEVLSIIGSGRFQLVEPLGVLLSRLGRPCRMSTSGSGAGTRASVFRCDGGVWTLSYGGDTLLIGDMVGLRYIAHLLARKERELHAASLAALAAGGQAVLPGGGSEVLDDQALAECGRRYDDLRFQKEEAERNNDLARQERLQAEIEALAQQVTAARGLGKRRRKMGDDADRVRKSVSNAITRAITAIGKRHPALARHLERSIHLGLYLRYSPGENLEWTI